MAILGFFVGKIEGRNPGFDLAALLTPEFATDAERSWAAVGARYGIKAANFGYSLTVACKALVSAATSSS